MEPVPDVVVTACWALVSALYQNYNRLGASGSTHVLFRLGDDLLVRLPRQPGSSKGIEKEQRWTPEIGQHLTVAVPEIVAIGKPGFGFSEQWSILRWLDGQHPKAYCSGEPATAECSVLAADLADVIRALRGIEVPQSALTDQALRVSIAAVHHRPSAMQ